MRGSRFLVLRILRLSLFAGALADAVFGLWILASPRRLARFLDLPLPDDLLYLYLCGLLLVFLACFYLLACRDPRRYGGNVVVAALARLTGAVFFFVMVTAAAAPQVFMSFAAMDLGLGLTHAICFWSLDA